MEESQEIDLGRNDTQLGHAIKAAKHVRAVVDMDLPVGEFQWIPIGDFDVEVVELLLRFLLDEMWGADAYTTAVSKRDLFLMRVKP